MYLFLGTNTGLFWTVHLLILLEVFPGLLIFTFYEICVCFCTVIQLLQLFMVYIKSTFTIHRVSKKILNRHGPQNFKKLWYSFRTQILQMVQNGSFIIKNRYETVRGGFGLNFWAVLAGNPNWSEKRQKTTEMRYGSYFPKNESSNGQDGLI